MPGAALRISGGGTEHLRSYIFGKSSALERPGCIVADAELKSPVVAFDDQKMVCKRERKSLIPRGAVIARFARSTCLFNEPA